MSTITIRLDEKLAREVDEACKVRAINRSLLVREAVAAYLAAPTACAGSSFLAVAGVVASGKIDLATNPRHLEGFGR